MAILDFFKKKLARQKFDTQNLGGKLREKASRLPEAKAVSESQKSVADSSATEEKLTGGSSKIAGIILERPHITEKSANLAESGVYVFRVAASATRRMVKRAVEELYRVRVRKVNTISTAARALRFGRHPGTRPGFRKAIITLVKGDKIEFV